MIGATVFDATVDAGDLATYIGDLLKREATQTIPSISNLSGSTGHLGNLIDIVSKIVSVCQISLVPSSLGGAGSLKKRQLGSTGNAAGPINALIRIADFIVFYTGEFFGKEITDAIPVAALPSVIPSGIVFPLILQSTSKNLPCRILIACYQRSSLFNCC